MLLTFLVLLGGLNLSEKIKNQQSLPMEDIRQIEKESDKNYFEFFNGDCLN